MAFHVNNEIAPSTEEQLDAEYDQLVQVRTTHTTVSTVSHAPDNLLAEMPLEQRHADLVKENDKLQNMFDSFEQDVRSHHQSLVYRNISYYYYEHGYRIAMIERRLYEETGAQPTMLLPTMRKYLGIGYQEEYFFTAPMVESDMTLQEKCEYEQTRLTELSDALAHIVQRIMDLKAIDAHQLFVSAHILLNRHAYYLT